MKPCDYFSKIPFPVDAFNPLQKEEFLSKEPCTPWPGPRGPQGPPGPKGDPGINLRLIVENTYVNLPDEEKHESDILWVIYPNGFFDA